jgi:hypothetical protein
LDFKDKLVVGRYIDLTIPAIALPTVGPGAFLRQAPAVMHIDKSEYKRPIYFTKATSSAQPLGMKLERTFGNAVTHLKNLPPHQRTSAATGGTHADAAKAHRNFSFLKWFPGYVNEVQLNGMDVLTGPMSGCWIAIYYRLGVRCVGHIGTDTDPAKTLHARTAWNSFVGAGPAGRIVGFNPTGNWVGNKPRQAGGSPAWYALVTRTGDFWSIAATNVNANRIRIDGIQKIPNSLFAPYTI